MRFLVEYFGLFVGGLVALPEIGAPKTSPGGMGGLILAFIVVVGGVHVVLQRRLAVGIENAVPHPGIGLPAAMKEPLVSSPPPSPPRA